MSRLYGAGQYNQEFLPHRLGNWEVAKWFPDRKHRNPLSFQPTQPIVDDRGHFLPGAPRANRNPWNNYVGTFDQPSRITRAIANDLSSRPPARLRYWDKPNPRLRPVSCTAQQLQGGPGFSLVAEGPGYPQHRNYFLNKQDYVEHADRVDEQDVVAVEFLKERKRRQEAVKERVEHVKELTAALRRQQEAQRQADAERDVQWLLEHRQQHNVVKGRGRAESPECSGQEPASEDTAEGAGPQGDHGCPQGAGPSPGQDQDEGIHIHEDKDLDRVACWERARARGLEDAERGCRDDGQDSGVGSVEDGHVGDERPERCTTKPSPAFPQFEDDSGELLKPSNPAYPEADPGFSRRAARDPTIQSYPEPERVREQGYPEMFTTETDLAAPAEARPETPPPLGQLCEEALPRVQGAALKCGRNPRGNPPGRPYARAQFAVVAPEPESPPASPHHRVPTPGPALANACSSFQVAKQLHKENLEHNPLPDTVNDDLFKKLSSQRHPNPGIALDVKPDSAAVGWRSFNAPGPTNCSKMKVYRPKTAVPAGSRNGLQDRAPRPSTGHPSKLLAKDHVSEMELAICWDLVPAYPEDEPKPTPHIDGSNGSAAPGIFSLVHHPDDDDKGVTSARQPSGRRVSSDHCHGDGHCPSVEGPRRTSTPPAPKDRRSPPKPPSVESVHSGSGGGGSSQLKCSGSSHSLQGQGQGRGRAGAPDHALHERLHAQERQRSAVQRRYNEQRVTAAPEPRDLCDFRKRNGCYAGMQGCGDGTTRDDPRNLNDHLAEMRKHRHHQSMPDLSRHRHHNTHHQNHHHHNPRPCGACTRPPSPPGLRRPKSEYKMAFKAGKPTTSLSTNSSFDTPPSQHSGCQGGCHGVREIRVPKQRAPFARKNYAITSLTQPFSLWPKETGHAYPEHWRLASVYQHSFKPVHARSKPLLKTVYQ